MELYFGGRLKNRYQRLSMGQCLFRKAQDRPAEAGQLSEDEGAGGQHGRDVAQTAAAHTLRRSIVLNRGGAVSTGRVGAERAEPGHGGVKGAHGLPRHLAPLEAVGALALDPRRVEQLQQKPRRRV